MLPLRFQRPGTRGLRRGPPVVLVGLLVLACDCGTGTRSAREVIEPFLEAVQNEDLEQLYCLMAGAAESTDLGHDESSRRAGFAAWAAAQYAAYHDGREAGWVELDQHGITAVKLLALGKGTFFDLAGAERVGADGMRVRMELRLAYAAIDLSRFSPGTTFYVCGVPLGRVHVIRKPALSGEETVEVVDTLSLDWTLVRTPAAGGCPGGWSVASVTPLEESVTTKTVTWVF